jgi:parvulin-like peptidyl-prolyl isomerase
MRTLALVMATCLSSIAAAQFGPKPVAVVNGEAIPRSELEAVLKMRPQPVTPLTANQQRQIQEQIVAALIDEALVRQFLSKSTPAPEAKTLDKELADLVEGLKGQNKSLADFCKETQQTEKQVRQGLELSLRWNKYMSVKLTDAELRKYYTENKDYFERATVRCSHIVYRVGPDASQAEKVNAEKKLRELREQIVGGKITFTEAAQKYSHCPSATKGGDLGNIMRKWMVEEPFAKAAFALPVNQVSDIVTTDFGVHLIFVTDRKAGTPTEYEKIKDEVRDSCSEELRQKLIMDLRKAAKVEVNL